MNMTDVLQAITTVGFPIVMCLILLWYIYKMQIAHKEETSQFTDALNNNTLVLQRLCDAMGEEREED